MSDKEKKKPIASVKIKCRNGIIDISFWENQRYALVKVDVPVKTGDQSFTFETKYKSRIDILDLIKAWIDLGKILKTVGEMWFIDFKRAVERIEEAIEEKEEEE